MATLVAFGLLLPAIAIAEDGEADEDPAAESPEDEHSDDEAEAPDLGIGEAMDELAEAEQELAAALERLERAEAELDAIDQRVAAAVAELNRYEEELEEARAAYDEAVDAAEDAADEVERADARVEAAEELEAEAVARLEARAAEVYKRGTTVPQQFVMRGIAGAGDWHEVAVTMRAFDRVLLHDRNVLDDAVVARALADSARDRAEAARADAEAAEAAAAEELERLERLLEEQEGVVASVQQERRRQEAIYAELEEDAEVMEALAARLEEQIQQALATPPTPEGPVGDNGVPGWAGLLPGVGYDWAGPIAAAAAHNGIDGRLFAALVWTESTFNPQAVSSAGAIGLAQLMPGTAASLGVDPWEPAENLDGGARYLRTQIDRFGSVELGLAAYNAGPGAVSSYGGIPPFAETQLYVVRVLERFQVLAG